MQVIATHRNTDFDALASLIAATLIFPKAIPVIPRSVNPNVRAFLSIHKDIFRVRAPDEIDPDRVTRLIVVDVNQWGRLGRLSALKHRCEVEVFLWDHHPDKGDIQANQVCHEPMGANITLMIRELKKRRIRLSPIQATLFLTGLHEDTGNLMFPSTRPEDVRAAAYLMEQEADLTVLGSLLRPAYGEKQKNVLHKMLQSEKRTKIRGYTVSFNKVNIEGHVGSLSVVVHMCRDILNVDAVFGIFTGRKRGKSIVIGRSNVEGLNIGDIMRGLGGGGHPGAGSAMIEFANPDTVEEMITELILGNQQASVRVSDLMSFPVLTVNSDTPMEEVRRLLREKSYSGVPVVNDGKLVGVISRRDFQKIKKGSGWKAPVRAFMIPQVTTIEPDQSPIHAARLMAKHDIGRLPVVQDGKLIGIVSRADVMRYFYDLLPDE